MAYGRLCGSGCHGQLVTGLSEVFGCLGIQTLEVIT